MPKQQQHQSGVRIEVPRGRCISMWKSWISNGRTIEIELTEGTTIF